MKYITWIVFICFCNGYNANCHRKSSNTSDMKGYIVKGVDVSIAAFPFVAVITTGYLLHCGGVIISDRVILTAAHCIVYEGKMMPLKDLDVYLGSSKITEGARYKPCLAIPHEKYQEIVKDYATSHFYDIGTMLLTQKIMFGRTVQKARFPPNTNWRRMKSSFTITGFGFTSTFGPPSETLKATRMQYVDSEVCSRTQFSRSTVMQVPDHMFCLINTKGSSDCFGDSGSGVVWKGYVVGLVATGRDSSCGSDVVPSMYCDVCYFKSWIQTKVKQLEALSIRTCHSARLLSNRPSKHYSRNTSQPVHPFIK